MKQKNLLKWTGCKNSLWNELKLIFDKVNPTRFVDVFTGSLSVSINYNHTNTVCNDINPVLMKLYQVMNNEIFHTWLEEYNQEKYNCKEEYEKLRSEYNKLKKKNVDEQVCALFLYLNQRGFNGIYRENMSGEYNVPFRAYKSNIFDKTTLHQFSEKIKHFQLFNEDYEKILDQCHPGDLVYLDPPYYQCDNNTFTSYFGKKFDKKEQENLCEKLKQLDQKGIHWVMSNANCKEVREMYSDFNQKEIELKRKMRHSSVVKDKESKNEILIWNFK